MKLKGIEAFQYLNVGDEPAQVKFGKPNFHGGFLSGLLGRVDDHSPSDEDSRASFLTGLKVRELDGHKAYMFS